MNTYHLKIMNSNKDLNVYGLFSKNVDKNNFTVLIYLIFVQAQYIDHFVGVVWRLEL